MVKTTQRFMENDRKGRYYYIDLFDFSLSEQEMDAIRSLDENKSMWCAYDNPEIVEMAMS